MTRKDSPNYLDEEFAAAADDFFTSKLKTTGREDAELDALLNTLQQVDEAFADDAEERARERIRKSLQKAWFAEQELKSTKQQSFQSKLKNFFWQNKRQTSLAFSFAMLLLFLVLTPFLLTSDPHMAGTAGAIISSKLSLLILGIFFVSILVLLTLKKRK